jgi:hypothetical protein
MLETTELFRLNSRLGSVYTKKLSSEFDFWPVSEIERCNLLGIGSWHMRLVGYSTQTEIEI